MFDILVTANSRVEGSSLHIFRVDVYHCFPSVSVRTCSDAGGMNLPSSLADTCGEEEVRL